jgi:hypothetical protein
MINETYYNTKYDTVIRTDGIDYSTMNIEVYSNESSAVFIGAFDAYPEDFEIYQVIKKCMLRENNHLVSYISVTPHQLNLHFIAHLGGFVKIDFELSLFEKNVPVIYKEMSSRLVPLTSLLNHTVDNCVQSGYICVRKDNVYRQNSVKYLDVYDAGQFEIMWDNIQLFPMLNTLQINVEVLNLADISNDCVQDLLIVNTTLTSLNGIQGFPELLHLSLENCVIPADFIEVLMSIEHKICSIEMIDCDEKIATEIENYCRTTGITFKY